MVCAEGKKGGFFAPSPGVVCSGHPWLRGKVGLAVVLMRMRALTSFNPEGAQYKLGECFQPGFCLVPEA